MKIGIPKEVKTNESRVAITDTGAELLVQQGHAVYIEAGAGIEADITEEQYREAGATILENAADVWGGRDARCGAPASTQAPVSHR